MNLNIDNFSLTNRNLTLKKISELNELTLKYGLKLTDKEINNLIDHKNNILKEIGRVEILDNTLENLIYEFCDSNYIDSENYYQILYELTNIFYIYQNEFCHKLTDEQIIKYLKFNFENNCASSIELLESVYFEDLKNKLSNGLNDE